MKKNLLIVFLAIASFAFMPKINAETLDAQNQVFNAQNQVGITYSENELNEIISLVKNNKNFEAKKKITPLLKWLEEATEYHTGLYKTLVKINKAKSQSDIERDLAMKSAMLRDKTMYQLALIYLKENNKKDAIKLFVGIVKSQPRTELGFQAYQQLQECGFTYQVQLKPQDVKPIANPQ